MSLSPSSPSSGSERCRYHGAHSQLSGPDDHHSTDLPTVERHQRALHEKQSSHFLLALRPPGGLPAIAGGNGSLNQLSEHGPNKLCSVKKGPSWAHLALQSLKLTKLHEQTKSNWQICLTSDLWGQWMWKQCSGTTVARVWLVARLPLFFICCALSIYRPAASLFLSSLSRSGWKGNSL